MNTIGAWRAVWLLSRLRLLRLANQLLTIRFRRKAKTTAPVRAATPAKRSAGAALAVLMVVLMSFTFLNLGRQSVLTMECGLAPGNVCAQTADGPGRRADADVAAAAALDRDGYSPPVARALSLQLALLFVTSFLAPLGSKELASTDWDLEWLVTLPVRRTTLLAARIAERSVANPTGLLAVMAPSTMIAWYAGWGWGTPLVALGAAAALLPIAAVLRTVADTGLRLSLSPSQLRNLQALCGVLCLPLFYLAMAFATPSPGGIGAQAAAAAPPWIMWTPPGLLVGAVTGAGPLSPLFSLLLLLAELVACLALGLAILGRQLRHGVVGAGVRESARRRGRRAAVTGASRAWDRLLPRSPIQRRELRLLSRDRNFLVQSLLMPVVIVGSQMLMNGSLRTLSSEGVSAVALGMIAFGVSAYMLMLSAFQTINSEGQVLWLLYTFPVTLEQVLKEKAKLWGVLALVYPLVLFGAGLAMAGHLDWHMAGIAALVLAGIPLYSVIAVALGVFASDPLSQDARTRLSPSYVYLYMLLASLYAYGIYAQSWWQSIVVLVLTAGLAQAFWQKARDALPYLLDPAAAPPARVSTADGMIAVMLFFVLQAVGGWFMLHVLHMDPGVALLVAFSLAGAVVYLLARLVYWRAKTTGVPRLRGGSARTMLALGLGIGMGAGLFGIAYLSVLQLTPWWHGDLLTAAGPHIRARWLFLLGVVAAPLFEEFIFRGLMFGGLRRSMGFVPAAVLSAALFAIVHPPVSIVPVFVLGLGTAFACERSKGLLAPMIVHALYNAAVLGFQLMP